MDVHRRSARMSPRRAFYLALSAALSLAGCASPGPPRSPSLQLPQPVRDLTATRVGNTVELRFTPPSKSSDKLTLRGYTLSGQLCRQLPHQPCLPVSPRVSIQNTNLNDPNNLTTWTDVLPAPLAEGPPQLLTYRVEFFSHANQSAGPSNEAFTASGPAPAPVENLQATGSRLGIVLQWAPAPGDVDLRRESLSHQPVTQKQPQQTWLQATDSKQPTDRTLDTTALPDTPYAYVAQRRATLSLGNHIVEIRSPLCNPVTITLQRSYAPPAPTGLTVAGYSSGTPPTYAADLIWQPVTEAGLVTPLAGYNLYREPLDASGQPTAPRIPLNSSPIPQPSFHDSTVKSSVSYRYSVVAVDAQGNQSLPSTVTLSRSTDSTP